MGKTCPRTFSPNFYAKRFLLEVLCHESDFVYTKNSALPRYGFDLLLVHNFSDFIEKCEGNDLRKIGGFQKKMLSLVRLFTLKWGTIWRKLAFIRREDQVWFGILKMFRSARAFFLGNCCLKEWENFLN